MATVDSQSALVRELKTNGAPKAEVDAAVAVLIELKKASGVKSGGREKKPKKKKEAAKGTTKGETGLSVNYKKNENFPEWYSQVITRSEMIDYYDISGCYILRPWAYSIWEEIQSWFDGNIKALGVKNSYFPVFVSKVRIVCAILPSGFIRNVRVLLKQKRTMLKALLPR